MKSGLIAWLCLTMGCVGRFGDSSFEPGPQAFGAMDPIHDEHFKIPDVRENTAEEKTGYVLIGVLAVAATVTGAILVPMALNGKL